MATEAQEYFHWGSYRKVPDMAPAGLLFLKEFLPAYDGLGPFEQDPIPLANLLFQDAEFVFERDPPVTAAAKINMIKVRAQGAIYLRRTLRVTSDIDFADGTGNHKVMFESCVSTVFAHDPPGMKVTVREFISMDLKPTDVPGQGAHGLKLAELRTYVMRDDEEEFSFGEELAEGEEE